MKKAVTEAKLLLIGIPVAIWTLLPIYNLFLFSISTKDDAFAGKLWPADDFIAWTMWNEQWTAGMSEIERDREFAAQAWRWMWLAEEPGAEGQDQLLPRVRAQDRAGQRLELRQQGDGHQQAGRDGDHAGAGMGDGCGQQCVEHRCFVNVREDGSKMASQLAVAGAHQKRIDVLAGGRLLETPNHRTLAAVFGGLKNRQRFAADFAAATAAFTSSSLEAGNRPTTSVVSAGFTLSNHSPDEDFTHSPPMFCVSSVVPWFE